jgi:Zn-dependent M28 family amino/carboxypeptidase
MDMIGRGKTNVVGLLGAQHNPDLERVVEQARKLGPTGIRKLEISKDAGLFQRSDHYSFHQVGIPSLFFMEDLPLASNREYHTWKDTVDLLDMRKIANTARLVLGTAWLLANDEKRPDAPRD